MGMVHLQRKTWLIAGGQKGKRGPTVSFTKEMNLTVAKDLFLSDQTNKQQFIKYRVVQKKL